MCYFLFYSEKADFAHSDELENLLLSALDMFNQDIETLRELEYESGYESTGKKKKKKAKKKKKLRDAKVVIARDFSNFVNFWKRGFVQSIRMPLKYSKE